MAAAGGDAAAAVADVTNGKEKRELNELALNESLMPFKLSSEQSQLKYDTIESRIGADDIISFVESLPNTIDATNKVLIRNAALGMFSANPKHTHRKIDISRKADPYQDYPLSKFEINLNTTDALTAITDVENGTFRSISFISDSHKAKLKADLLDLALFQALVPLGADASNEDREQRSTLITNLLAEKKKANSALQVKTFENELENKVKANLARQSNVPSTYSSTLVAPPNLGKLRFASADLRSSIGKLISHTPFGHPNCNRPLKDYLDLVNGIINGSYDETGSYSILESVLAGPSRQYVRNCQIRGVNFKSCWSTIQLAFGKKSSSYELTQKLAHFMKTRPSCPVRMITTLTNIILEKNEHFEEEERRIISNTELKNSIFSMIYRYWPSHYSIIKKAYMQIVQNSKENGAELNPPDLVLSSLCSEFLRQIPSVGSSSRIPEIHTLQISDEFETTSILSEEDMCSLADFNESGGVAVDAFQSKKGYNNNSGYNNSSGYNNGGARSKRPAAPKVTIPSSLFNRCALCGSKNHNRWRNCSTYPNITQLGTQCSYCGAMHGGRAKCISLNPAHVYEVETESHHEGSSSGSPHPISN